MFLLKSKESRGSRNLNGTNSEKIQNLNLPNAASSSAILSDLDF